MGQASKRRHCPALAREITPADCGEHRQSTHACPPECPFNPFAPAQYGSLLALEDRLDLATLKWLVAEKPEAPRVIAAARQSAADHGANATALNLLFFQPDGAGRSVAQRWEHAGFPGLKNDERVFFRGKMGMRVALLEVQTVLDEQTIQFVDLLDPARPVQRLVDRQIAARAVRFGVFFTWLYPLPHFWRLSGTGVVVPDFDTLPPEEIIRECIAHLGGPGEPGPARARWLAENYLRVNETLTAAAHERRRLMFADLDAQFGAATYDLVAPFTECRTALVAERAVARDDLAPAERAEGLTEAMVWFEPPADPQATPLGTRTVRGRVLLGPRRWRVEAIGGARLAALRASFEARLGPRVRFTAERRDDVGARQAAQEPVAAPGTVPPRLLEGLMKVELHSSRLAALPAGRSPEELPPSLAASFRDKWLDTPVPALDGRTPRQAAGEPALRARLLPMVKGAVRRLDEENLRAGRVDDINAMVRELGLTELDFPPPPLRPVPARYDREAPGDRDEDIGDDFDEEDEDDDTSPPPGAGLPPPEPWRARAPRLTGPPLTQSEASERVSEALDLFRSPAEAFDELARSGATVMADVEALAEEWLSEAEFALLATFLVQGWFALVPFGVRAPVLRRAAIEAALERERKRTAVVGEPPPDLMANFVRESRQPALLIVVMAGMVNMAAGLPASHRPSAGAQLETILITKVILDELDFSLRQ
ncbi:MAG: hypothetical protein HY302_12575 [Opitutae bacterium]|nr:hypothetical protein [Opitutae bacterium]